MTTQNVHQMTTIQNIEYQNINPKNRGAVDKWTNLARLLKNKNEYAGTLFFKCPLDHQRKFTTIKHYVSIK